MSQQNNEMIMITKCQQLLELSFAAVCRVLTAGYLVNKSENHADDLHISETKRTGLTLSFG